MKDYVFWLAVLLLLAWWFFMGDTPIEIARAFLGRGKQLTTSSLNTDGSLVQSPEDLQNQVQTALGRSVALEAVLLARVSASEHAGANQAEKTAIQWVCKNDAVTHGWDIRTCVTVNPGTLGTQPGRRYSTAGGGAGSREIHEDDLAIAESIVAGTTQDPTSGATKFIHWTNYDSFSDYLAGHPAVAAWENEGLVPQQLPGTSTLIVFTKNPTMGAAA
jgi:hypothetical protein